MEVFKNKLKRLVIKFKPKVSIRSSQAKAHQMVESNTNPKLREFYFFFRNIYPFTISSAKPKFEFERISRHLCSQTKLWSLKNFRNNYRVDDLYSPIFEKNPTLPANYVYIGKYRLLVLSFLALRKDRVFRTEKFSFELFDDQL